MEVTSTSSKKLIEFSNNYSTHFLMYMIYYNFNIIDCYNIYTVLKKQPKNI